MALQLRKPLVELIEDANIRESLQWIYEYLSDISLLRGQFEHFDIEIQGATTEKIPHKLGFIPKDVILTSVVGTGVPTFEYAEFDKTYIVVSTTASCVIRFFAGRYENEL